MSKTRVHLGFTPYAHQRAAHALREAFRFLVLVWHRRAGKTVFAVMELVYAACAFKGDRGRFGYVAPFLKQAKDVAWDYLKQYTRPIPGCVYNEAELSVTLPNGHMIRLYGADHPDSLRGIYFDGLVGDEVADWKPNVWGEILRPALADRKGWALFIGTPKGVNLFSALYQLGLKGEDGWKSDLKRASDTGVIPTDEIEQARRSMSAPQFAQEFDCDFAAAVENALVPLDVVLAAQRRVIGEADYRYEPKILGVDVARYGDDRNVAVLRQGRVAFKPTTWRGLDLMASAGSVARTIDKLKPDAVFIDGGGPGGGVVDRVQQLGFDVIEVDFASSAIDPRFENARAEMWVHMAEWMAQACIPDDSVLAAELTAPTYTYANRRGRCQLESKDDMRKRGLASPDWADALACTFFRPVAHKHVQDMIQVSANRAKSWDYDPMQGEA